MQRIQGYYDAQNNYEEAMRRVKAAVRQVGEPADMPEVFDVLKEHFNMDREIASAMVWEMFTTGHLRRNHKDWTVTVLKGSEN